MYLTCFLAAALIEPFPSREATEEYLSRYVNPTLLRGLIEVCKHKPHNPCVSINFSVFFSDIHWWARFIHQPFISCQWLMPCCLLALNSPCNMLYVIILHCLKIDLAGWLADQKQSKHATNMRRQFCGRSRMTAKEWDGRLHYFRHDNFKQSNLFCDIINVFFTLFFCFVSIW